jgi:hypothetical protein
MTPEETKAATHFTPEQLVRFRDVCELLQIAVDTPAAHSAIAKLYFNSLITAFHAGRFTGMKEMKATSDRHTQPPQVERAALSGLDNVSEEPQRRE